ncbi:hypothetical protein BDV25DRAFT_131442 [Aspergillus avenaceus]|uniref:Uncharacterized protein n=1 Tax=Aspergillus avenaceus TaxID=36643 RepID=A0A5N6TPD8_ASPAV|nr:hypothetical protein BDV25DRAFT_131442 [Aspergillus avenaceus]
MSNGFAVRKNGSCLRTEVDCGETVTPFRGCCPGGTACPIAYNIDCCPPGKNCTESIVAEPTCANSTWNLYQNEGFYYCCPYDTIGFAMMGVYDGCAGVGYSFSDNDRMLKIVSSGSASSHTSAPSSSSSGASKGAIAGGVIGGVAGVALIAAFLYLFMKRRSSSQHVPMQHATMPATGYNYVDSPLAEMDGRGHPQELESRTDQPVHELPAQFSR